ncbi:MAG: response regulator [Desulfamplus sp.]|nr:response regulator [Desulfamplus sp.]
MDKSKIVIIDDTPSNLKLLMGILDSPEYLIYPISDPVIAIDAIKEVVPDIILLDIIMPKISGYDLCKLLKLDPITKNIPVIFITSRDNIEDKIKGFSLGAVDYITKPFLSDEVIARVQIHIKTYALQKSLQRRTEDMQALNNRLEHENLERRKIEEELRESYLWLNRVFNALEEAVIILNPDRVVIDANPAAEKIFGYTREELKQQSCEIFHVDYNHFVEFKNKTALAFEKGETINFEYRAKRKNGTIFPSEHSVALLKTSSQKSIGMVSVVRDLTEKKKAEEQLRESEKLKTVLEITGAVCHEMNQPLMAISGYSELALMDIPTNNPAQKKLKKIQKQVERMAEITKKLMRISRYRTKDYPDCKIVDLVKASEDFEDKN